MTRSIFLPFLLLASLVWPALADYGKVTCAKWYEAIDFLDIFPGFESECITESLKDLNGHSASEILFEIIMESKLPNETFYANDLHVTCLFANSSFLLSGAGFGPFTIPEIASEGSLCLYVTDVDEEHKGGLDLGQIRNLTQRLIHEKDCNKCGEIPINFFSGDKNATGSVTINWSENAVCRESENCIDPKDLAEENKKDTDNGTTGSTVNGTADKKNGAGGAVVMGTGYLGGLMLLGAVFAFVL